MSRARAPLCSGPGPTPRRAVGWNGPRRCAIEEDQSVRPDPVGTPSVPDVLAPALARSSALADELAQLLVPARLFS